MEQDYVIPSPIVTHQLFAVNACDSSTLPICQTMSMKLKSVVDKVNIWRPSLDNMPSVGEVFLGDLETLGWVVIVG